MDDIDNDLDAHAVSLVNQVLELFRSALARGDGEEAGDVVAETGVVSVLLDSHELDHIVAGLLDSRQDFVGVVLVVAYAASFVRHADVRLIDPVTCLVLSWDWIRVLPLMLVNGWWVPVHTVKQSRIAL